MNKHQSKAAVAAGVASAAIALAACGGGASGGSGELKLASQFGLSYLPDTVMASSAEGFLEEQLPDTNITSAQLSGGGAVVEQLLSGAVDVGYMGVGPFINAVDSGADLKAISCLEEQSLDLMVTDPAYNSLADIPETARIGLPSPSSHQAFTLQVASNNEFGDPARFDKSMVGLPHPDAMAALLNDQDLDGHFTQAPFTGMEEADGARSILNSYDVFGRHCLIVAVASSKLAEDKPDVITAMQKALDESTKFVTENPEAAADILEESGDSTPRDQLLSDITSDDITWTTEISNLQSVADQMFDADVVGQKFDVNDLVFDGAEVN